MSSTDGQELRWVSVTIPPVRAVYGWQADGENDVYLVTRTPYGPCLLARWPRIAAGHPPAWDMCRALGTAIEVTSPDEGKRLAAGFERGECVYPHPAWQQASRARPDHHVGDAADRPPRC